LLIAEQVQIEDQIVGFGLRFAVVALPRNPFDRVRRESEVPRL
jgi:hypothetical protein